IIFFLGEVMNLHIMPAPQQRGKAVSGGKAVSVIGGLADWMRRLLIAGLVGLAVLLLCLGLHRFLASVYVKPDRNPLIVTISADRGRVFAAEIDADKAVGRVEAANGAEVAGEVGVGVADRAEAVGEVGVGVADVAEAVGVAGVDEADGVEVAEEAEAVAVPLGQEEANEQAIEQVSEQVSEQVADQENPALESQEDKKYDAWGRELREGEEGVLTGRPMLWYAGFRTFLESPVFGVTRENLSQRVGVNLTDPGWMPDLEAGGVHNGPLTVLICSGLAGFLPMMVFAIVLLRRLLRGLSVLLSGRISGDTDSMGKTKARGMADVGIAFAGAVTLVALILAAEVTESRILYQVNVFFAFFWTICGYASVMSRYFEKES
ncbi:MAG: O-antigen ligase family protein, partial [Lachnospiraceae bacterium]|nr:O-antigen ligase family protein [Lachnospiraceae bacterium]